MVSKVHCQGPRPAPCLGCLHRPSVQVPGVQPAFKRFRLKHTHKPCQSFKPQSVQIRSSFYPSGETMHFTRTRPPSKHPAALSSNHRLFGGFSGNSQPQQSFLPDVYQHLGSTNEKHANWTLLINVHIDCSVFRNKINILQVETEVFSHLSC